MRLYLIPAVFLLGVSLIPRKPADPQRRPDPEERTLDLCLEVQGLRVLYLFRMNGEQVKKLQAMAKELAAPDREREKPRVTDDYRRALASLRDALAADDQDKAEELEDRLSELTESESPELDDAVGVTAAARRRVPEAFRLLRPKQLGNFFGSVAEEVGDPQERLVSALEQVRSEKNDDWEDVRDDLADDVAWLLGGLDADRSKLVRTEVADLLTRAHNLNEDEFGKQRADLEKAARGIGANVASTEVLQHAAERALARLLSNPRLSQALQVRLKLSP
jgi:hypothetical protein